MADKLEEEEYVCDKGHYWSCSWARNYPITERYDCCSKCMDNQDLTAYLPADLVAMCDLYGDDTTTIH